MEIAYCKKDYRTHKVEHNLKTYPPSEVILLQEYHSKEISVKK